MLEKKPISNASPGFTLLELLLALTLVSVILLIVFGALRIGVRAWEKGERDLETRQRERVVLTLMKHQLASMSVRKIKAGGKESFFLKGDDKSMEFISELAAIPGNELGVVYVRYVVDSEGAGEGEGLLLYEENVVMLREDEGIEEPEERDFRRLLSGARAIAFSYYKEGEGEEPAEWRDMWDPETERANPRAVKVTIDRGEDESPISTVARIVQTGDA